ncbi:hypothetical protein K7J31_002892 [Vibrio parahaemolyticus]|nr:hypothetical protein [Vibrio parahaemolyticus]
MKNNKELSKYNDIELTTKESSLVIDCDKQFREIQGASIKVEEISKIYKGKSFYKQHSKITESFMALIHLFVCFNQFTKSIIAIIRKLA